MSMQDPIADMFSRVMNAQARHKPQVLMPSSRFKCAIAAVLRDEGYIVNFSIIEQNKKPVLAIDLKYYDNKPVIGFMKRVSRPGLRRYFHVNDIPKLKGGLATVIMTTSKGVMSGRKARKLNQGGEVVGYVACED